jgi:manganese-transporting P-type ATPase
MDTFVFIFLLVLCAIGAAVYVLNEGWYDERRNRFRLILHVVIIVTSVVPPELPMELSLAVTNSVADLMKRCNVFCTEHFRIPWAGEVDVCCFDKTGTL